ncbi:MAG TPA: Hsp20/alpha crystallin family protein [Candidatus Polarisedimenticolia bacterium]|jgi:HSP20 family protein|nr:Hsp20/alpha crystallin family protein [Candidatus Polarisedimenticolia bacterium]
MAVAKWTDHRKPDPLADAGHGEHPAGTWCPPVDIFEAHDRVALRVDLPGVAREDFELRVEDGVLVLRGHRRPPGDVRPEEMHRAERPHGTFMRSFSLPQGIDQARIRAVYRNGVLEIVLPRIQESRARSMTIEVER